MLFALYAKVKKRVVKTILLGYIIMQGNNFSGNSNELIFNLLT